MNIGLGGMLSNGKTVTGVRFCVERAREKKKDVIGNIFLDIPGVKCTKITNEKLVLVIYKALHEPEILQVFQRKILFLDEIGNLVYARKSSSNLNEILIQFLVMAGKLDCDVIYTYQVENSQVDKVLRELGTVYCESYRLDARTMKPILDEDRRVQYPILIYVEMTVNLGLRGMKTVKFAYDPSPYYPMYRTEEISLLDRFQFRKGGAYDFTKMKGKIKG